MPILRNLWNDITQSPFSMGQRLAAMRGPGPLTLEALMTPEEVGFYHGYRVALEQDEQGWRAKATIAGKPGLPMVCWSNRRDIASD
jgi:hypothetical protein